MSAALTQLDHGTHSAAVAGDAADRCHSSAASTTTLVSTQDVLQRYERLLVGLTEQVLEQQADIRALRAALHAATHADPCTRDTAPHAHHRRRRRHKRSVEAGAPTELRAAQADDGATPRRDGRHRVHGSSRSGGGGDGGLTTPHVSAILAADGAELDSLAGRSPAPAEQRADAVPAAAAEPREEAKAVVYLTEVCPLSPDSIDSHVCDVSASSSGGGGAAGLTPSPAARDTAAAARSPASLTVAGGTGTPVCCHDASSQHRTPSQQQQQTSFDGADAMDYLLTLFSSSKSAGKQHSRPHDAVEGAEKEYRTPTESTQQRRRRVARELFGGGAAADEEDASSATPTRTSATHHRSTPMTHHDVLPAEEPRSRGTHGDVDEAASWQERYARIVACALAAEAAGATLAAVESHDADTGEPKRGNRGSGRSSSSSPSPFISCVSATPMVTQSALSQRDASASAQVTELLRLFTSCTAQDAGRDGHGVGLAVENEMHIG